jgi:sulfoxide reductase heme-binding subunit YedZ
MVDPTHQVFWFASRAFGLVAMVMLAVSVAVGLTMSGRLLSRPGLAAKLKRFHESAALVTLGLIAAHGGLLLFDTYLRPGLAGITVPFTLGYRPLFTGIGVIAGWLAAILGLSFYARKRIGVKTWRSMHRFTIVVYLLVLTHVVGAGTDAHKPWMMALLGVLTAPIVFAFSYRILPRGPGLGARAPAPRRAGRTPGPRPARVAPVP